MLWSVNIIIEYLNARYILIISIERLSVVYFKSVIGYYFEKRGDDAFKVLTA